MKKISAVMIAFILLLTVFNVNAQPMAGVQAKIIEPYPLAITSFKTTNIIFPSAIVGVDRGSKDVLAQKAKGADNILQIKAARDGFPQTNLTVVTADGMLHSFVLTYAKEPLVLNISLAGANRRNTNPFSLDSFNKTKLKLYTEYASQSKERTGGIKDKKYGIRFSLNGVFVQDKVMYLRVSIKNRSNINYDIDQLRFFVRDRKRAKRTASQEVEIRPVDIQNNTNNIVAQSSDTIVFAVPKFTLPDKKYLSIQLMEKNGGRHMELKVKNKSLVNASVLTAL